VPHASPTADPFQALADPTRRALLDRLRDGPVAAGALAEGFPISRPAISQHLRVLRDAGLVREARDPADGRQRIYPLTPAPLREVAQWTLRYQTLWEDNLGRLKRHLERRASSSHPRSR
jgi:DNA-binding transcriptional ArsR family regulator